MRGFPTIRAFLVVNFGPNFVSAVEAQTPIITGFRVSGPPQVENFVDVTSGISTH